MSKKSDEKKLVLTPKTAHNIAFTVHKRHFYDCREVDDILDALLELIDRQESEKCEIDEKLRQYEANIAGIMLECQKLKAAILEQYKEMSEEDGGGEKKE